METPKKRNEQSYKHKTGFIKRNPVRNNEPLEPHRYPSQLERYYSLISHMTIEQEARVFGGRLKYEVMDELEAEERRIYEEENRLIPQGYPSFNDDFDEIDNELAAEW